MTGEIYKIQMYTIVYKSSSIVSLNELHYIDLSIMNHLSLESVISDQ